MYSEARVEQRLYLVRFSLTRFSLRMIIVSWRYFMRGEIAWKKVTHSIYKCTVTDTQPTQEWKWWSAIVTYIVIVDGVRRQADVLDVPPQLRQHLHTNIHLQTSMLVPTFKNDNIYGMIIKKVSQQIVADGRLYCFLSKTNKTIFWTAVEQEKTEMTEILLHSFPKKCISSL